MKAFEGMTWQEIDSASGGKKKGTNNHFIPFEDMIKDAQKRAENLNLLQHESLYSLRIKGAIRLFGVLNNGIYHIVWYDSDHAIYLTSQNSLEKYLDTKFLLDNGIKTQVFKYYFTHPEDFSSIFSILVKYGKSTSKYILSKGEIYE